MRKTESSGEHVERGSSFGREKTLSDDDDDYNFGGSLISVVALLT